MQSYVAAETDWDQLEAMSDEEVVGAALADPDAQPLTEAQSANMRRAEPAPDVQAPGVQAPGVQASRSRLGMTQRQFARTYRLPIGTVRDWEQGRSRPDAPAQALLRVIEREPDAARRALGA